MRIKDFMFSKYSKSFKILKILDKIRIKDFMFSKYYKSFKIPKIPDKKIIDIRP